MLWPFRPGVETPKPGGTDGRGPRGIELEKERGWPAWAKLSHLTGHHKTTTLRV